MHFTYNCSKILINRQLLSVTFADTNLQTPFYIVCFHPESYTIFFTKFHCKETIICDLESDYEDIILTTTLANVYSLIKTKKLKFLNDFNKIIKYTIPRGVSAKKQPHGNIVKYGSKCIFEYHITAGERTLLKTNCCPAWLFSSGCNIRGSKFEDYLQHGGVLNKDATNSGLRSSANGCRRSN